MKIKFRGELHVHQLRQAIYEQLHLLEQDCNVRYVKDVTIYATPTNGFGDHVLCKNESGKVVETMLADGPYVSVADEYDL